MKWAEYLQSFRFFIKKKSGDTNIVADALSRRRSLLTKMKVEVLSFDDMKKLSDTHPDFFEPWRECRAPNLTDHISKLMNISFKNICYLKEFSCVFLEVL